MQFLKISLLFIMLWGEINSAHAALTCTLSQSSGAGSATGTLTVGRIGTNLTYSDITAWNISITVNSSTGNLTNGSIDTSCTIPPTIVSTANSLTITPEPNPPGNPTYDSSCFHISNGTQMYGLRNEWLFPGSVNRWELFIPAGTSSPDHVYNSSPPSSLNLTCTCAVGSGVTSCSSGSPVSASVDLISNKQPQTYPEEIIIK